MFLKAISVLLYLLEEHLEVAKDLLVDVDYLVTLEDLEDVLAVVLWFPVFIDALKEVTDG